MSPEVTAIRATLSDPQEIAGFDLKFEIGNNKMMLHIYESAEDFAGEMSRFWNLRNPQLAFDKTQNDLLDRLPELFGRRQKLINEVYEFADSHPRIGGAEIPGIASLVKRLTRQDKAIEHIYTSSESPTKETVLGLDTALNGVEGELRSAMATEDVVEFGRDVSARANDGIETLHADVDVVAESGRAWIDSKTANSFSIRSSSWQRELRPQAQRLIEIASKQDSVPRVVYDFWNGVSSDVARALEQLGKTHGVRVEVIDRTEGRR